MEKEIILEVRNVTKTFGSTVALTGANLEVERGAIHSLVGRNGAGKSTLVNVISGVIKADNGAVYYGGTDITPMSLRERQALGIRLVTQHASIVPDLDVAENISMGLWTKNKLRLVDWKRMYEKAGEVLEEFGLNINPRKLVRHLTPVDKRKVNIIRALFGGGKFIILDEPTTSLSSDDRDNLFYFVRSQAEKGITFILISHYLEEILRVSDEITVIRDGAVSGNMRGDIDTHDKLASLVAGEDVELVRRDPDKHPNADLLIECEGVSAEFLQPTDTEVRKGEIVGYVGFPGSGARELCCLLYGLIRKHSGVVRIDGKPVEIKNVGAALKNGVCYIPNDRHTDGIVGIMPIDENIGLSNIRGKLKGFFGFLNLKKEREIALHMLKTLKIKAPSIRTLVNKLSGGNQQKVVLAKMLSCNPRLFILDEPTVGIDIKSREEIMGLIKELTNDGMSVIYLTNDYDELLRIADRVVIFNGGHIVREMENVGLTPEKVIEIRDGGNSVNEDNGVEKEMVV
ncbi:MAG: sugar ABC transporter ATP-binding protein [Synergistaceae bacterium]|nr:sugar ABC transporter ATP-binding protein [Synergistaceae bacterium]